MADDNKSIGLDELPTMIDLLVTCNRMIHALEDGTTTPAVGNAVHNQVSTVVRIIKLELDAVKLINRTPTLLPKLMPSA